MALYLSLKRGEGVAIGPDIVLVAVEDKRHPGRLAIAITAPKELAIRRFGHKIRQDGEVITVTKG